MLKINKEFKDLIPELSKEEYKQLEANLISEGCRDSLIVWNNTILDGHNRYEICTKHNIAFSTKEALIDNKEEAIIWIIKNQFGRRNLPVIDRIKLAQLLKDKIALQAKDNQLATLKQNTDLTERPKREKINTREELAKISGTSTSSVARYNYVMKHGNEKVKEEMNSGKITLNAAKNKVKKSRKPKNFNANTRVTTAEIDKIYQDMKTPIPVGADTDVNNDTIDNPIISDLNVVLKTFKINISKYTFMGYQETSNGVKNLLKELVQALTQIDEKIKER